MDQYEGLFVFHVLVVPPHTTSPSPSRPISLCPTRNGGYRLGSGLLPRDRFGVTRPDSSRDGDLSVGTEEVQNGSSRTEKFLV